MKIISSLLLAITLTFGFSYEHNQVAQVAQVAPTVTKEVLANIRHASVTIEVNEKYVGSGTLIEKQGVNGPETYCLTAAHVISGATNIRITQYQGKNAKTIYASIHKVDTNIDYAILKVGKGVFDSKIVFHKDKQELDTPIIHCGSFSGFHHSVTRGTLVGLDREFNRWKCVDQLDITAFYGSSGGGVFDNEGRYLGMIVAGVTTGIVVMLPARLIEFE